MSRNFPPTKFSTHKIFHTLCSAAYTWSSLDRQHFVMSLFCYLRHIENVLDTQGPLSQAVLRVMGEEVNRQVYKAEAWPTENRACISRQKRKSLKYPLDSLASQQMDQHSCHSRAGIVAVLPYWPPKCLGGRGCLLCSFASQTQPTPGRIAFSSILKRFALGLVGSGLRGSLHMF